MPHLPLLPRLQRLFLPLLVRLLMVVTAGRHYVQPISLDRFPLFGGAQCSSSGYHNADVTNVICDVDATISASSAERILLSLPSDIWTSCRDAAEEVDDEFAPHRWSIAIIVARSLSLGNASRCVATPKRRRPIAANQLTNERLQKATAKIRADWSTQNDCPIDFLLLLTERFRYCDERTGLSYDVHNLTALFDMDEKMRRQINVVTDLVWNEPPLLAESASIQEESKVNLIIRIIRLYTMLARGSRKDGLIHDYGMDDEFSRVKSKYLMLPPVTSGMTGHTHPGIPVWAWAAFISAILLSAAAAYVGMYIGSTGRFAQTGTNKKTSGMRMRKRSAWAAGFGGGVMQFSNTANAAANGAKKPAARMLGSKFGRINKS